MPVDVLVPPLGTTVDTLTLISWYKQEGDTVFKDEMLFSVETDKATLDVESPATGILSGVCAQPGAEIAALTRIASILAPGEAMAAEAPAQQPTTKSAHIISSLPASPLSTEEPARQPTGSRIFISPRAKQLAEEHRIHWRSLHGTGPEGVIVVRDVLSQEADARPKSVSPIAQRMAESSDLDWSQLSGSGPGGKVVREDVLQALAVQNTPAPERALMGRVETDVLEILPLSGARAVIASRMMQSVVTTAPVTLTSECDATALVQIRSQFAEDGLAISYNSLLLKILAHALKEHPRMNASLEGDVIKVWRHVHLGLAVDSEQGLRVPVVRDVDRKNLIEIERKIDACIESARAGKALPEEMRGGTFTLTNLGMFGIDAFTPVIDLPQCGILGAGRIKAQPSVVGDAIVIRQKMWISLTFDHRLIDGGPAARFLQRVSQLVEKPHLLLT